MKPRRAQERHTHLGSTSGGWLPDAIGASTTPLATAMSAPDALTPTNTSDAITRRYRVYTNSVDTSAWGSGGQRAVNASTTLTGYSRTTGWRTRSVFGSEASWDTCPAVFAGMITEYQGGYQQNNFIPFDPEAFSTNPTATPPDSRWDAPSTITAGDGTYFTGGTLTKTSDQSWTWDGWRSTKTWGDAVIAFLDNGTAVVVEAYGGIAGSNAGFPQSYTATCASPHKIVGIYGVLQSTAALDAPLELSGVGKWVPTDGSATPSCGSWMNEVSLAANWYVFLQDGYCPAPFPMPVATFTGVRAYRPPYGSSTDPKWLFHSHADTVALSTKPTLGGSAVTNRGLVDGGLGFNQTSTIDCVPGHIYSLVSQCDAGGTTVALRLKDLTTGRVDSCVVPAANVPDELAGAGYMDVIAAAGATTADTPRMYWVDYRANIPAWETLP